MKNKIFLFTKSLFLIFLFLVSTQSISAQQDSTFIFQKPEGRYYHQRLGKWASKSRTLGIIPEIHGFDYLTLGVSVAEINSSSGEGALFGTARQVGVEYIPGKGIIAPKVKVWKAAWAYFMGYNIGGSGMYYFRKDASSFALRPEIGLGIVFFQINYGYTFFFNKKFDDLNPHGFSVSMSFPILP